MSKSVTYDSATRVGVTPNGEQWPKRVKVPLPMGGQVEIVVSSDGSTICSGPGYHTGTAPC